MWITVYHAGISTSPKEEKGQDVSESNGIKPAIYDF